MGTKARSGCGADVAVINGALHAFEIKSDSDSLERLPGQIEAYRAFSWKPNKVYAESFKDEAHLRAIVEEAQLIVTNALAQPDWRNDPVAAPTPTVGALLFLTAF